MSTEAAPQLLEQDIVLRTFSDFIRAVPERWRKSPVYITDSIGKHQRVVSLALSRDKEGKKVILISCEYPTLRG